MKKIKNIILMSALIMIIAIASVLAIPKQAKNSDASSENIADAFGYVTLTQSGQVLNFNNLKTFRQNNVTTRSIVSNKNTSFNFKPLTYNYTINSQSYLDYLSNPESKTYFINQEIVTFTTNKKTDDDVWIYDNNQFEFEGDFFTYDLTPDTTNDGIDDRTVRIFRASTTAQVTPVVTQASSSLISFEETETLDNGVPVSATRTITITTTITPNIRLLTDKEFGFSVAGKTFLFTFEEPITIFEQNSPIGFTSIFNPDGTPDETKTTSKIPSENTFSKMQIDFLINNYTESNPLFFDINYNGFVFNFELYSKEYNGQNYLFVNYYDENKNIDAETLKTENQKKFAKTTYLATPLMLIDDEFVPNTTNASELVYATDNFSLSFANAGRYEFKIYDSTYTLGLLDSNYYPTSFYIRKNEGGQASIDNIYIVAESLDDEGTHQEYIVSGAVLNNDIRFSIKNIKTDNSVLDKITITKTIFGNEENVPVSTTYTVTDLLNGLTNDDFVVYCTEDASYTIDVYEKGKKTPIKYQYTVLKKPKSHFSDPDVGSYTETSPYTKTTINYTKPIDSLMSFNIRINNSAIEDDNANTTLNKKYIDHFKVIYGKIQVAYEEKKIFDEEGKEVKTDAKTYTFMGVGNITLIINYNGVITTKELAEGESKTVTFSEYGSYEIQMKDDMGTQLTSPLTFKVTKSLNTSALVLIILISIVVLAVTLFVIIARSKISTR